MRVYQEITLLPQAGISGHFLMEKVFQQVHIALADNKSSTGDTRSDEETASECSEYGISFPDYSLEPPTPGGRLRIFAESGVKLEKLDIGHWLERMRDYCRWSLINPVPGEVSFARFSRRQFHTNVERLARRRAKRHGESFQEALNTLSGFRDQTSRLPYINVESHSGNERFRLFIEKIDTEKERRGFFNCYGLSKTATVPWFT
jgi:CRISPR-associated endonuclease Csy4